MNTAAIMGILLLTVGLLASQARAQAVLKISSQLSQVPSSASASRLRNAPPPVSSLRPVEAGAVPAAAGSSDARGVIRAVGEAMLSSRLAARITRMPLQEGQSFKKGDVLVEFDCERQVAESRAARAQVRIQERTVDTNEELDHFNAIGKNDLAISRSQYDKSKAELDALSAGLKDCRIVAPFPGRVIERVAHTHEAVSASQPLLRIADTSQLELDMIVPSAWLQWLTTGTSFEFQVDETGQTVTARIDRVNAAVDPVSKTIKVVGRFQQSRSRILPGMSGLARFSPPRS